MTERQIKLLRDYGPRFLKRAHDIQKEFLYLPADAAAVLTDTEWEKCAEEIDKVVIELTRMQNIVCDRMKEAGLPVI